jgi:hypothetical protein
LARCGTVSAITVAVASEAIAAAAAVKAFCFPCLTACGTALRLVSVTSRLELLLFICGKGKGIVAVGTGECFVFETHWMASSLNI